MSWRVIYLYPPIIRTGTCGLNFRRSVIKLCQYKNAQEVNQNLSIGKGITLNLDITDIEGSTKTFSEDLKQVEIEVNEKISQFLHKGGKDSEDDKRK
jgi:hypothetical protein